MMFPLDAKRRLTGQAFIDELVNVFREHGEDLGDSPSIEVSYVRYKPGTSCLFGLDISGVEGKFHRGYIKIFESGDPEECFRKYSGRAKEGGWAHLFDGARAVYFNFPLDRSVRGLPFLVSVNHLKHRIHESVESYSPSTIRIRAKKSSLEILRYKPERRCIVSARLCTRDARNGEPGEFKLVAQAYAGVDGARTYSMMRHIASYTGNASFRIPKPLGYDSENRILFQEFVNGRDLYEDLLGPGGTTAAGQVALALKDLQALPVPNCEEKTVSDYILHAKFLAKDLISVGESLNGAPDEIVRMLDKQSAAMGPMPPTIIHGDCHYHQFIRSEDDIVMIDWDESRVGPPLADAGNFLAHIHMIELDGRLSAEMARSLRSAFLESYPIAGKSESQLAFFVALHLFYLSLVPFRNLRTGWRNDVENILNCTSGLLESTKEKGAV